jgi:hypothetical protein
MKALLLTLWLACGTLHAAMLGNNGWDWEAHNWRSNVFKLSAGGSLGSAGYQNGTLFMQNTKRWDVRRFLGRVNLYLGADTNAVSVCIIGDWFTTTPTNDLLIAFTAADYSETNGLTGDAASKYIQLNGGNFTLPVAAGGAPTNFHMAAYVRTGIGGTAGHIGGIVSGLGYWIMNVRNSSDVTTALLDSGQPTAADTDGTGFYVSTRGSSTLAHVFRNGTVFITDNTAMASSVFSNVSSVTHAINNSGTIGSYSSKTLSYFAHGYAIPANREVAYNLAVQYSQKLALRKVGP